MSGPGKVPPASTVLPKNEYGITRMELGNPRASEAIGCDIFVNNIKGGNRPNGGIRAREGRKKNEGAEQDHLPYMKARGH